MKDIEQGPDFLATVDAFRSFNAATIASTLHRDFLTLGLEDGLYVKADGGTFLRFLEETASGSPTGSELAWVDVRGRVASACLVHRYPTCVRTTVLTAMRSQEGWRIITATFAADDGATVTSGRQERMQ